MSLIPRGLVIAISVGVTAGAIFGIFFVDLKNPNELNFVEGTSITILTEKTDFEKGEKIEIKIINSGTVPISFVGPSTGLKIKGLDGTVLYSAPQASSTLEPKGEKIFEWDQIKNDGDPVHEGTYKITLIAWVIEIDYGKLIEKSITINILK